MNPRILLVDDEPEVLEQLSGFLQKHKFENPETASSFQEAEKKASENHFDIIISDMVMESEKAGYELVQKYKDLSPLVIIVSARITWEKSRDTIKSCFRAGAYDFIEKDDPDAYQQIVDNINKAVGVLKSFKQKIDKDGLYMQEQYPEFCEKLPGQYVAILDERVITSSPDYEALVKDMEKKFPYVDVTIVGVPEKGIHV